MQVGLGLDQVGGSVREGRRGDVLHAGVHHDALGRREMQAGILVAERGRNGLRVDGDDPGAVVGPLDLPGVVTELPGGAVFRPLSGVLVDLFVHHPSVVLVVVEELAGGQRFLLEQPVLDAEELVLVAGLEGGLDDQGVPFLCGALLVRVLFVHRKQPLAERRRESRNAADLTAEPVEAFAQLGARRVVAPF